MPKGINDAAKVAPIQKSGGKTAGTPGRQNVSIQKPQTWGNDRPSKTVTIKK